MAAVLQTGVNLGVMLAGLANFLLADFPKRSVFLVGILPALLVLLRPAIPRSEVGFSRAAPIDRWLAANRRTVLSGFALAMLASFFLLPRVVFDFNPLHLRDPTQNTGCENRPTVGIDHIWARFTQDCPSRGNPKRQVFQKPVEQTRFT